MLVGYQKQAHIMKRTLLISILSVLTLSVLAQDPDVAKAKTILDKVSEKTKGYKTIKADFALKIEDLQTKTSETHDGSISLKGNKYKISVMDAESYFDGTTLWVYLVDANEVNISDADMVADDELDPSKVFTIHEQGFRYRHVGETTIKGKVADIIDLVPEDRNKPYSRIKLYVYRDTLQPARLEQMGKDGTNFVVEIKKMEVNTPITDDLFVFKKEQHPGVEIIDLR